MGVLMFACGLTISDTVLQLGLDAAGPQLISDAYLLQLLIEQALERAFQLTNFAISGGSHNGGCRSLLLLLPR